MSVSPERLQALAAETGFLSSTLEKVIRLGEILGDITRQPLLSGALALKGGSALNLFFSTPERLSADLDFNYIASVDRERMLRDRPEIERLLSHIARGRGYRVQWSRDGHAGRKTYLNYTGADGAADRIEVDLNFLFRLPLEEVKEMRMWQPGVMERPQARVVAIEELAVGKLCALLSRSLPRDLFDAIRLPGLASGTWGTRRFRRLFIAVAGTLDRPLHQYGPERFTRMTDAAIEEQLHPMLIRGRWPRAAELSEGAWSVVAPLLELDDAEREYTDRLQAGELRPDLLFPDDAQMAERVRQHPALLWKAKNAASHARRATRPRNE